LSFFCYVYKRFRCGAVFGSGSEDPMRIPEHPTLIRRMLDSRLKRLPTSTPVLAASLIHFHRSCGVPSCHCMKGGAKHPSQHLTFMDRGKTRSVYVPVDLLPEVRTWIAEHRRLKLLLREISQLTLALVRTHVRHRKRKQGRP
jgi:hypothetical protein